MGTMVQEGAAAARQQQASACPTCGETITRQFCPACGEHKFDRLSFSLKHFAHHAAHELFDLDSKILRTVRYLFSRPGFVTAEYLAGKKSRYMNPLRLYVVCFALATLTLLYHSSLDVKTLANLDKTGTMHRALAKFAQHKGVSEDVLFERLEGRLHFYHEWSNIVNALAMAWLLAVVYRKQKWYFGEHAVTALYFLSFTSLLTVVRWPFWIAAGTPMQGARAHIFSLIFLMIAVPYLWVTLRRLHGEGRWKTAAKSVLVYGGTQLTFVVTFMLSFFLAMLHTALVH